MVKINFFCTANNSYVPQCIVTLKTFRKHHPNIDCHILGSSFSLLMKNLMKKNNIKYFEVNLKKYFYKEFFYPSECFYHFYAPSFFLNKGFSISVALDGDLYCNGHLGDIEKLAGSHFGAVGFTKIKYWHSLKKDLKTIRKNFHIHPPALNLKRPHSGVIFYNNHGMKKLNYFNCVSNLFDKSIKAGIPRKGDDSLLSLFVLSNPQCTIRYLPSSYNMIKNHVNSESVKIFHMNSNKPWKKNKGITQTEHHFISAWCNVMKNTYNSNQINKFFPNLYENTGNASNFRLFHRKKKKITLPKKNKTNRKNKFRNFIPKK